MKPHRLPWLLLFALSLLVSACGGEDAATPDGTPEPEKVASVRTVQAQAETVVDLAVLSADLEPRRRAVLAAEVPGVIEELHVDVGDAIEAGGLVARIDTRGTRQQLAEAEALHRQAVDRAERAEALFARRSITEPQRIDAVAQRDVAEARLSSAQLALEKSEIRAPWSGRVAAKRVEVGDYAVPGQPVVELVDVRRIVVRAEAPATDVPYLELGRPVQVRIDVFPGEVFEGKVTRLGAELDPATRTLDVEAELDNADGRLRPGLFGRLELARRRLENAVAVPLDAVVDFETHKVVYVVEEGRAHRREVQLGPVLGDRIVISEGVRDGERVVIRGQDQVAEGQRVEEAEG